MTAYRSIDGTGDNQNFNATATDMTRVGTAHFADGISEPIETVNPRTVCNNVVGEGDRQRCQSGRFFGLHVFMGPVHRPRPRSGQFRRRQPHRHHHPERRPGVSGRLHPFDDPHIVDPANHNAINQITGWLDASMVYGSTQAVADSLRTGRRAHERPRPVTTSPSTPTAACRWPAMCRAAENPGLTALQTLFVREHNYQVDQLAFSIRTGPVTTSIRKRAPSSAPKSRTSPMTSFCQSCWGRICLTPYHGFDPTVDPRITEEFAGAAYRFGHSIVVRRHRTGRQLRCLFRRNRAEGRLLHAGHRLQLRSVAPTASCATSPPIRRRPGCPHCRRPAQLPGDAPDGMDLAAINIQRGHDLGLGTLNETREALQLDALHQLRPVDRRSRHASRLKPRSPSIGR